MADEALKITSMEELEDRVFGLVVIDHPHPKIGRLVFKVRRGLSADLAIAEGLPISNPLLNATSNADASKAAKEDLQQLTMVEYMRRIAKAALVQPKFEQIDHIFGKDLVVLGAITREATGLPIFGNLFTGGGTFRPDEQGDTTP